uniref:SH2 domain-containing protein n=1 Tax=Macrostomum lignano TaxID=282301 RepID=A0A1I8JEW3_9PLAT
MVNSSEPPELPPRPPSMMAVENSDNNTVQLRRRSDALQKRRQESPPPPALPPRDSSTPVSTIATIKSEESIYRQVESLDCWVNCTRQEANKLLLSGDRQGGTYLLRPCHSRRERGRRVRNSSVAALVSRLFRARRSASVVEGQLTKQESSRVKHYLVRESPAGYYLYSNRRFKTVVDLIAYYATSPEKRQRSGALLRRSIAAAVDEPGGEEKNKAEFAKDSRGRRVRLVRKVGEGTYQMFLAEVGGVQVVSLILDTESIKTGGGSRSTSATVPRKPRLDDALKSNKLSKMLPVDCERKSCNLGEGANRKRSARSVIRTGALLLQEAIGRVAAKSLEKDDR